MTKYRTIWSWRITTVLWHFSVESALYRVDLPSLCSHVAHSISLRPQSGYPTICFAEFFLFLVL